MKIYTAGPDVFYPDAVQRLQHLRELCIGYGHVPLTPFDAQIDLKDPAAAQQIYLANIRLIRQCDVVIANVDNFRGMEPDSGTCFELGYAVACHKDTYCYYQNPPGKTLVERLGGSFIDETIVEGFGLPLNLMLAKSCIVVEGTFEDVLKRL